MTFHLGWNGTDGDTFHLGWLPDIDIVVDTPTERGDGGSYEHKIYLPEKMPDYDIDDDIVIMAVIKKFLEIMND